MIVAILKMLVRTKIISELSPNDTIKSVSINELFDWRTSLECEKTY